MSHKESSCQRRKVLRWVALVSTPTSLIQQVANSFVSIKCHRTFVRLAIGLLSDSNDSASCLHSCHLPNLSFFGGCTIRGMVLNV